MSKTLVVLGYSPNTRTRMTAVVPLPSDPADWDQVNVPLHVAHIQSKGQVALVGTLADYQAIGPDRMINRLFSLPPISHNCALVDGRGKVIGLLGADPFAQQHWLGRYFHDPHRLLNVGDMVHGLKH
jgi:hypothetical protein